MNKVFKVIWSEARNAYVVVSEMAKSHGTKSCSTKKLLAMLIATGVMTCASMAPAMADNPAPNDKNVTIGKGAVSAPYDKQTGNVAIGENAKAWNGTGRQEAYVDFGQGGIQGGLLGATVKDGTKLPGSIAIGKNTVARSGSTMIGDHGYTGKIGDITIAPDGNGIMKYNNDVYSTTIGANSFNSGALASVTGAFSIASSKYDGSGGFNSFYAVQNTGATVYGSLNSIESATSNSYSSGIASSVLGFANRTQNANAALIWGTGNEVTNSIENIDIETDWNKLSVTDAQKQAIKAMQSSKYAGGSVMAIGGGNKADYATYSELTGVQNKVTGTKDKAAKYDLVNGYQNTVYNASDVTVIGIKNEVTADGNKVIGDNHNVSGKDNVIFGSADQLTETTVNNAVVLGHNAKVTGEGGVALGAGSVANRANAVSVGSKDAERQIINVAAGTEGTDAVNVSQLQKVSDTANAGWNLSTNGVGTKATNVKPGDYVDFSGDKNISVSHDGTKVQVELNKNIDVNSIKTNALNSKYNLSVGTMAENGIMPFLVSSTGAFYAANNNFSVDKDGKVIATAGEIGNVVLQNGVYTGKSALRDGELYLGDASGNYSQITPKSAKLGQVTIDEKGNMAGVNSIKTNALNSKYNLSVGTMAENGIMPFLVSSTGAFYAANNNFSVDKDGKVIATAGEIGNVVLQNGVHTGNSALRDGELYVGDASGNYSQITTTGAKLGQVTIAADGKISGVAAGTEDTDAVNVSQLNAVKETANKGWNLSTNGGEASKVAPDATVDFSGDKNISVSHDGTKVQVELNKNIDVNYVQTNALNAKYNLSVGTANENGTVPFLVSSTGAFYAANNNFSVDKDGKVIATAGEIGNVVLQNGVHTGNSALRDGELYLGDASGNYSQITPKSAKLGQVTIDEKGNMAGVNSIQTNALNAKYNLSVGTMAENGIMPFLVNSTGAFYAANNNFSVDKDGKVIATAGKIGNVVLQNGVHTGNSALRDGELYLGDASGNYSQITTTGAKLGQVTIAADGKISGVAAGEADTDAVNVSQLKKVSDTANAGWNLSTNGFGTEATNVKPGDYVDFRGDKNISVSHDGTKVQVELNKNIDVNSIQTNALNAKYNLSVGTMAENGIMPFLVNSTGAFYAANNNFSVDKDGKVIATAGKIGNVVLKNGVYTGNSALRDGELYLGDASGNYSQITPKSAKLGQVTIDEKGNMAGVNSIQTNALNAKYNLSVGTMAENGIMPFLVSSTGAFYAANNNFSVDKDGKVIATAGKIGNVVLKNGVYTGNSALRDGELYLGDASGNYSQITPKSAKLGQVTIDEKGNMAGVNSIQTNALNAKYNLSVGTMAENGIMPFLVNSTGAFYAANNNFSVDKDGKVIATAGKIGNVVLKNGVYTGNSALRDGELYVGDASGNYSQITTTGAKLGKVTIAADGKISGVAAGAITETSTDAVNGSQLHAVATEAGKHTTLSNGKNTTVESTVKDGQTDYKVNVAGDLTDITSVANGDSKINLNKDSIIISNGNKYFAITNSGIGMSYIGADYSAKSIMLGENGTTISGGLNVAGSKITGVAAGEVSKTSTDAINGSQLNQTNENVAALDKRVTQNEADIAQNKADIAQNKADIAQNKADIAQNKADIAQNKADIAQNKADIAQNKADIAQNKADIAQNKADIAQNKADIATNKANIEKNANDIATNKQNIDKLNTRVDGVEKLAKQHTTVTAGDNIAVTETTNKDGGKEYNVALKNKIDLGDKGSVTTGQTEMNNDGLKVGDKVSVTATAVTAGKTSISDEGVKVGDKTYINDKGLNANGQNITNVADGKVEKDSKDAINGGQLHQAKADINNRIDGVENQVVSNTNRINQLGSRVNKVGAGAAALAALHPMDFDPDDKLTFSAGYGNYGGENAAAIGAYYRPDEKVMFSVAGTVGNGENMVNAGVSFALDRTNHVSNSRTALAREVIDLRGQLAVMGAKMAKMEKAFGMLDETKTKLFPDVPANHWAYEYIAKLAGNGYIEGYPDGNFGGDRLMTRYEFAAMLYRAIEKGAALEEKIIKEFEPELGRIRVDRISGEDGDRDKIERVRVNDTKGERDHYGNKLAK